MTDRDSCWGWLVVAAATLSQTLVGGICLTGGIFYVIYRNAFHMSPVEASWLFSLPLTVWFMTTPVGSMVTNRYGYRTCAFLGGVIAALGLCLSYFAPNPAFLFFSHGILTGLGFGLNYAGCMAAVNDYFDKYRTLATGITTVGHNLGMVVFSIFILYLDAVYSWRGAMLVLGAIAFNFCCCALIMRVPDGVIARPSNSKPAMNLSVLKKSSFLCFCISNVLCSVGNGVYLLHLPSYAKEIGFAGNDFALVLSIYGLTNVVGKVVLSALGQHPRIDVTVVYSACLTLTGLGISLTPVFLTKAGMFTLAGLVGFSYCVTGALLAAVIFRIVGHDRFVDGVGVSLPFKATGNLIGGPLGGLLYAASGDYTISFLLGGGIMILSGLLMIQPVLYHRRQERSHKKTNIYLVVEGEVTPDALTKTALLGQEKTAAPELNT